MVGSLGSGVLNRLVAEYVALRADDAWTATGSVVWLAGCAIWAMPHLRTPEREPAGDHD